MEYHNATGFHGSSNKYYSHSENKSMGSTANRLESPTLANVFVTRQLIQRVQYTKFYEARTG